MKKKWWKQSSISWLPEKNSWNGSFLFFKCRNFVKSVSHLSNMWIQKSFFSPCWPCLDRKREFAKIYILMVCCSLYKFTVCFLSLLFNLRMLKILLFHILVYKKWNLSILYKTLSRYSIFFSCWKHSNKFVDKIFGNCRRLRNIGDKAHTCMLSVLLSSNFWENVSLTWNAITSYLVVENVPWKQLALLLLQ